MKEVVLPKAVFVPFESNLPWEILGCTSRDVSNSFRLSGIGFEGQIIDAHKLMESNQAKGKIVIKI